MCPDQDARLSLLSSSINRQHHLSLQIGSELEEHHDLLLDTEAQIDRTGARLSRARGRLNGLVEGGKKNGESSFEFPWSGGDRLEAIEIKQECVEGRSASIQIYSPLLISYQHSGPLLLPFFHLPSYYRNSGDAMNT